MPLWSSALVCSLHGDSASGRSSRWNMTGTPSLHKHGAQMGGPFGWRMVTEDTGCNAAKVPRQSTTRTSDLVTTLVTTLTWSLTWSLPSPVHSPVHSPGHYTHLVTTVTWSLTWSQPSPGHSPGPYSHLVSTPGHYSPVVTTVPTLARPVPVPCTSTSTLYQYPPVSQWYNQRF